MTGGIELNRSIEGFREVEVFWEWSDQSLNYGCGSSRAPVSGPSARVAMYCAHGNDDSIAIAACVAVISGTTLSKDDARSYVVYEGNVDLYNADRFKVTRVVAER